jgi:hypothetical protein
MLTLFTILNETRLTKNIWLNNSRSLNYKKENNNTAPIQNDKNNNIDPIEDDKKENNNIERLQDPHGNPHDHYIRHTVYNRVTGKIIPEAFPFCPPLPIRFRKSYTCYVPLLKQKPPLNLVNLLATLKFPKNRYLKFFQR